MSAEPIYQVASSLSEIVAENVRAESARRGYSQSSLARALGMQQTQISRRWRGAMSWSLDEIEQVASILGIEATCLIARPEGFEPPTFWSGVLAPVIDLRTRRLLAA